MTEKSRNFHIVFTDPSYGNFDKQELLFSDHVRSSSGVSLNGCENFVKYSSEDDLKLEWLNSVRAHPQPLTCLDCQGGRILTGSHVSFWILPPKNLYSPKL